MKGEHKPGYRRPRTGEKRSVRQPLRIDGLSQEIVRAVFQGFYDGFQRGRMGKERKGYVGKLLKGVMQEVEPGPFADLQLREDDALPFDTLQVGRGLLEVGYGRYGIPVLG